MNIERKIKQHDLDDSVSQGLLQELVTKVEIEIEERTAIGINTDFETESIVSVSFPHSSDKHSHKEIVESIKEKITIQNADIQFGQITDGETVPTKLQICVHNYGYTAFFVAE